MGVLGISYGCPRYSIMDVLGICERPGYGASQCKSMTAV